MRQNIRGGESRFEETAWKPKHSKIVMDIHYEEIALEQGNFENEAKDREIKSTNEGVASEQKKN